MRIAAFTIGCCCLLASCVNGGVNSQHEINPGSTSINLERDYFNEVETFNTPAGVDPKVFTELKQALLRGLIEAGKLRGVSAATMDQRSQANLAFDEETSELKWGHYSTGDYDQNGEVNVADITPIAIHFGESGSFDENSIQAVIDGDANGEINLGDITPIAVNFGASTTAYQVYTSLEETDYPTSPSDPNGPGATVVGNVPLTGDIPNDSRRQMSFVLDAPEDGFYWVRPTDGVEEGTSSTMLDLVFTENTLPVANLLATPLKGDIPMEVSFDARGSTDDDGEIVKYEFDWDGAQNGEQWVDSGTDGTVLHSYADIGLFDATVRVTDNRGGVSTTSIMISASAVGNDAPDVVLQASPTLGDLPLAVEFDASASFDVDNEIVSFEWDFNGDGNYELDTEIEPLTLHTYYVNQVYEATVRATDEGGASATAMVSISVSGTPEEWTMFGHDTRRTGLSSFAGPQTNSHNWGHKTGGAVTSSPAIGLDGTVYVGSEDGYLYAINPDGTLAWRFLTDDRVMSSPSLDSAGNIYIGSNTGEFTSLTSSGDVRWRYQTAGQIQSNALINSLGEVIFGSGDGDLYCLNNDGFLNWKYSTPGAILSSPALGLDDSIIFGHSSGNVIALDSIGEESWSFLTGAYVASSPAVASDGTIYIGSDDGNLYALNSDGTLFWNYLTLGVVFSSPAIGPDGNVYVGSLDGNLYSLSPTGDLNWQALLPDEIWSSPAVGSNGTIYIGCNDHRMYTINPAGEILWSFLAGNLIQSSPAIARNGTLYIGSEDTFLHSIGGV